MNRHAWAGRAAPGVLGVVVHGPALLGRSGAVAAGLRCAFAYPDGVELVIVVAADDTGARSGGMPLPVADQIGQDPWADMLVTVRCDDRTGDANAFHCQVAVEAHRFERECRYFIDPLPTDPTLLVAVAWPQIGLTEHRTELRLDLEPGLHGVPLLEATPDSI